MGIKLGCFILTGSILDTSVLSVLDQVTKGPLLPHLYELALSFAKMDSLELSTRHVAVQALGIFWLIQPKLMVETDSRTVIGSLFQHSDSEILLKLLVSFYDLLKREQERMKLENDKSMFFALSRVGRFLILFLNRKI